MILGAISCNYSNKLITEDALFSYISSLLTQASSMGEDEELISLLDHIDDNHNLASEGIYGNIKDVIEKTLHELKKFDEYIDLLQDYS